MHKKFQIEEIHAFKLPHDCDIIEELNTFCAAQGIVCGAISLIGSAKEVKLSFYGQNDFKYTDIDNPALTDESGFEIVSASGNITLKDGRPFTHLHMVVSNKEGHCFGGHVMKGTIIFAGEAIIEQFKGEDTIGRSFDPLTKLSLWS